MELTRTELAKPTNWVKRSRMGYPEVPKPPIPSVLTMLARIGTSSLANSQPHDLAPFENAHERPLRVSEFIDPRNNSALVKIIMAQRASFLNRRPKANQMQRLLRPKDFDLAIEDMIENTVYDGGSLRFATTTNVSGYPREGIDPHRMPDDFYDIITVDTVYYPPSELYTHALARRARNRFNHKGLVVPLGEIWGIKTHGIEYSSQIMTASMLLLLPNEEIPRPQQEPVNTPTEFIDYPTSIISTARAAISGLTN